MNTDRWLWRFIALSIIVLLVLLPVVIIRSGSLDELQSQVLKTLSPDGVQFNASISDPLEGVFTLESTLNTPVILKGLNSSSEKLILEECVVFSPEQEVCQDQELLVQESVSQVLITSFDILLPIELRNSIYEYSVSITNENTLIYDFRSDPQSVSWEPIAQLRTPQGEPVVSESISLPAVYILVSRLTDISFEFDGEKYQAQKMVNPVDETSVFIYEESPAFHTWLLALPESSSEDGLCISTSFSSECFAVRNTSQDQSDINEAVVLESTTSKIVYPELRVSHINPNSDLNVIFVYFVQSAQNYESDFYLTMKDGSREIPSLSTFELNSYPGSYFPFDTESIYSLSLLSTSGEVLEEYEIFIDDMEIQTHKLRFSSEEVSSTPYSLGAMTFNWESTISTAISKNSELFTDLSDDRGVFMVNLTYLSQSPQDAQLVLEFPAASLNITKDIASYEEGIVPLEVKGLEYGYYEIKLSLLYEDKSESAEQVFEFQYRPSSEFYDKNNQKFLLMVFSGLFVLLLFSYLRSRLKAHEPV